VAWLGPILVLVVAGRGRDARELASFIPDCLVLFRCLLGDLRVPLPGKLGVALLVPYLALPFDLVPDFIPVAGQLDDAILVAIVLAYVVRLAGRDVVTELWPGSKRGLRAILSFASD
jgi:uncharacterized membrane protein YkvA (DUF1232 family)